MYEPDIKAQLYLFLNGSYVLTQELGFDGEVRANYVGCIVQQLCVYSGVSKLNIQ